MIWIEVRKAARSRLPIATALGILLVPVVDAFFMIILRDPESARKAGLISAKAQMMAGVADWPTFLNVLAQATAIGGIFLFSLIASWVFGREFADGTVTDLLAVPVPRDTILVAKYVVVCLWSFGLIVGMTAMGCLLGLLLDLPGGSMQEIYHGLRTIAITALLVVTLMTPVAFFASFGRGYFLPIGTTIVFVLFANVLVVAGWGHYFPWSIPALFAGAGDGVSANVGPASFWAIACLGLAGLLATHLWWRFADHGA